MAMLVGIECPRRRRFHQSAYSHTIPPHSSSSFLLQRSKLYQAHPDEILGGAAREAKQRLDEKFSAERKSENKRLNSKEKLKECVEGRTTGSEELHSHVEICRSKKRGPRRFSWTKLRWKASEQEDCAVCLKSFKVGETLIHLNCAHRFHSGCLDPWAENYSRCPCCR